MAAAGFGVAWSQSPAFRGGGGNRDRAVNAGTRGAVMNGIGTRYRWNYRRLLGRVVVFEQRPHFDIDLGPILDQFLVQSDITGILLSRSSHGQR